MQLGKKHHFCRQATPSSIHPHLKPLQTDVEAAGEEAVKPDEFVGAGVALGGLLLPAHEKAAQKLLEEVLHPPQVELYELKRFTEERKRTLNVLCL